MPAFRPLHAILQATLSPWHSSGTEDILTFDGGIVGWSFVEWWHSSYGFQYFNHGMSDTARSWLGDHCIKGCRVAYEPFLNRKELYASSKADQKSSEGEISDYQHQNLPSRNHIRLVHILGGPRDSPITIRFSTVELSEAQNFETLSYVWGAKRHRKINCERSSLMVRENLYDALLILRKTDEDRVFWIDSLCINQDDLDERAQQVAIMRSIYATSERTAVWLGKEAALSDDALGLLRRLLEVSKMTEGGVIDLDQDQSVWRELGDLYGNMWFYRIWIIQELVVARSIDICLGKEWWDWVDFATASQFARDRCKRWQIMFDPMPAMILHDARNLYQTYGPYPSILYALARGKNSFAGFDVDKVYAVLGLTNDPFDIDYKESAAETYVRLAKTIISRDYASSIFDFVDDHSFRLKRGLPSWVPDWEVRHGPKPLTTSPESLNWKASLDTATSFKIEPNSTHLVVRGFVIDTLDRVGDLFLEETPVSGAIRRLPYTKLQTTFQAQRQVGVQFWTLRRMKQWDNFKKKHAKFYPENELQNAFLQTLIAGSMPSNDNTIDFLTRTYATWCKIWVAVASNSYSIAVAAYSQHPAKDVHEATEFFQIHVIAAWYRRLFTTKTKGLMGLCPNLARRHDLLVILHGVRVPLLLRRQKNGTYRFMGQAYVQGVMYGEAMAFEESNSVQEFVIV